MSLKTQKEPALSPGERVASVASRVRGYLASRDPVPPPRLVSDPSPGPRRLVKTPDAVHPLPWGEGRDPTSLAGGEGEDSIPILLLQRIDRGVLAAALHWACVAICGLFLAGCRLDMHVQPKYKPLDPSSFFGDGRSARPEVPGTVAHGHLRADELLYTGRLNGQPADAFPFPITREVLVRGRERYNIYCSPCHDYTGSGGGLVVQRGFPPPPSYHLERLTKAPAGHFFDVITNGYGAMYSYASRVTPEDRWAIVAYIRALQLSQHAKLEDAPPKERERLTEQAK